MTAPDTGTEGGPAYTLTGLTHMVRQYGNPLLGESYTKALATPSPAAVLAENDSLADARATGVSNPSTTRAELTSHSDDYRDFFDSTSIKRNYTG